MKKKTDGVAAVRQARLSDAQAIFALIGSNTDLLVPRSLGNVVENIDRFFVAEDEKGLVGCASWQIHPEIGDAEAATVEVQSVAVRGDARRRGTGSALVRAVAERVAAFRPREIVVLTFAPRFFASLGFAEIPKRRIMHKLYTGCMNCTKHADPFTCPEIAMTLKRKAVLGARG